MGSHCVHFGPLASGRFVQGTIFLVHLPNRKIKVNGQIGLGQHGADVLVHELLDSYIWEPV